MIIGNKLTRRYGKTAAAIKELHDKLTEGAEAIVCADLEMKNYYVRMLKEWHNMDVKVEEVYTQSGPRVIFDPIDWNPEPAMIGLDYGERKLFGYKFIKK